MRIRIRERVLFKIKRNAEIINYLYYYCYCYYYWIIRSNFIETSLLSSVFKRSSQLPDFLSD